MSEKQDRSYARTAQDIERKYSFGKTFADMLGLINDSRDKVDSVESALRNEITEQATVLSRNTEEIVAQATKSVRKELNDSVSELEQKVELKLDANEVSIVIDEKMSNGVERVETSTGYTFDSEGLHISKEGDGIANVIDNTGMYVKYGTDEMLTANGDGVNATNLYAKTYLIIGENGGRSRFEDYTSNGEKRTGCFWVG